MTDLPIHELRNLLNRTAAGDDLAMTRLYRHYQPALARFVRNRLTNAATAEEIVQDTFKVAFLEPHRFNYTSRFSTWLCGIASNKTMDAQRKMSRQPKTAELDEEISDNTVDPDWDILTQLDEAERIQVLRLCIDKLPDEQRRAMKLTLDEDLGIDAVALELDCPPGTVKSRLFHARRKIQECVEAVFGNGGKHHD